MADSTVFWIAALTLGYGAFLVGGALLLGPMRREMAQLAAELYDDPSMGKDLRRRIDMYLDTALSFRIGLLLPFAVISAMIDDLILDRRIVSHAYAKDPRYHALLRRYFISILAANPFAALVSGPLMLLHMLLHALRSNGSAKGVVEEPVARASGAVTHCHT